MRIDAPGRLRLIALDVDGTLAGPDGRITAPVREAVAALMETRALVAIATGRTLSELSPVWAAWPGLRRVIYSNGAGITGFGPAAGAYGAGLTPTQAQEVYRASLKQEIMAEVYLGGQIYVDQGRWANRAYYNAGYLDRELPGSRTPVADMAAVFSGGRQVEKVNLFFHAPEERAAFVQACGGLGLRTSFTIQGGLEFNNPLATKAAAISYLAGRLGIGPAETAALGDSETDVELLKWAGVSIAMGNASAAVKAAAKLTAPANSRDGAAWAIRKHLLPRCE